MNDNADLYHPTCRADCPSLCSNKWSYWDGGEIDDWNVEQRGDWFEDSSINVSCDMNHL